MSRRKIEFDEAKFVEVARRSLSMSKAAKELGLKYNTFLRYAKKLGVFKSNQPGLGITKIKQSIDIQDILQGKYPTYTWNKNITKKLVDANLKTYECENCGLGNVWLGKPITLQLHHIDGNSSNNALSNLQLLCPNCHSQTKTWGRRNRNADMS